VQREPVPLGLAYVDVDNFKRVNDLHGHAAGDHFLRAVAQAIRETVRTSDVAARLGGDEFAVLFVGLKQDAATLAAERLLQRIRKIAELYPGLPLGASIGMAMFSAPPAGAEEMIRAADSAMYEAKQRGKGRIEVWSAQPGPQPAALPRRT
jgi:diguanylate cyclase (GGDEF)-like protein